MPKLGLTIECTFREGFEGGAEEETLTLGSCKVSGLSCQVSSFTMNMKGEAPRYRHLAFSKTITETVNSKLKAGKKSELCLLFGEFPATFTGAVDMSMSGGRISNSLINTRAIQLCEAQNQTCPGTQTYICKRLGLPVLQHGRQ